MKRGFFVFLTLLYCFQALAQTNPALNMSEMLMHNTRFNPADTRQNEILKNLSPNYLISNLKSDNDKYAFWLNIYNSYMLTFLRDTCYEGVYTNFYKLQNVTIAGKIFSLFDIEHEFIRLGKKSKALKFKKSKIKKDTTWLKLRPLNFDYRSVFLMYRGLYGYPAFQTIEYGKIDQAYLNQKVAFEMINDFENGNKEIFDWVKPYWADMKKSKMPLPFIEHKWIYIKTPLAVQIKNFYPKYEGPKFIEEEKNQWLK